jgi:FtsP/CotA-like multicopper oxidase with cupredoxin domain
MFDLVRIHLTFYRFLQTRTPEEDGVPGVSQCPIAPGKSFTYRFRASLYGTSWWHSHYSAQYSSGAFGAIVIHGPSNVEYDIDVGSILMSDFYHRDYFSIVEQVMQVVPIVGGQPDIPAIIPISDNNLINGMNNFDCSTITDGTPCTPNAPLAEFKFERGKMHRLRLINGGSEGIEKFSIDGHELLVIANDFTEIIPYTTKIVTLAVRYVFAYIVSY